LTWCLVLRILHLRRYLVAGFGIILALKSLLTVLKCFRNIKHIWKIQGHGQTDAAPMAFFVFVFKGKQE